MHHRFDSHSDPRSQGERDRKHGRIASQTQDTILRKLRHNSTNCSCSNNILHRSTLRKTERVRLPNFMFANWFHNRDELQGPWTGAATDGLGHERVE